MANIEIPDEFIICTKCGECYEIGELKENVCPKCGCKELLGENEYFAREVGFVEQPTPQNVPKCPICGSTDLSKITIAHKAGKIALFGIFGIGDNGKTWKCNNCGSKF